MAGPLQAILVAERTALNFLQRLSGVATQTRKFADAVAGLPTQVLDTRKTTPGWRLLEKYAVRMGGGTNHRIGLYDAILIKDNHVAGVGGDVAKAVELARTYPGNAGLAVEVEVDSLDQLDRVLPVKPDIVLLDNMTLDQMRDGRRPPQRRLAGDAAGSVRRREPDHHPRHRRDRRGPHQRRRAHALGRRPRHRPRLRRVTPSPEVWHFDTHLVGREVLVYDELPARTTGAARTRSGRRHGRRRPPPDRAAAGSTTASGRAAPACRC